MTKEQQRERLLDYFKEDIALFKGLGMSMSDIAEYLYKSLKISYIERDLLKEC